MRQLIISVIASLFLAFISVFLSAPAVLASSNSTILFSLGGINSIYKINPDGTGLTLIGNGRDPQLSPDGTKILYFAENFSSTLACGDSHEFDLYTMNTDGSNITNLTAGVRCRSIDGVWSPDGTKIAFYSVDNLESPGAISVMNADGSNATPILINSAGVDPSWSPDGTKIAYTGDGGIFVMNADGSNATLIHSGGEHPSWSPDGTKIAYQSWQLDSLYTINPDGSGQTTVFTAGGALLQPGTVPAWSPDSSTLAFSYYNGGITYGLYSVSASGGGTANLIYYNGSAAVAYVSWGKIPPANAAPVVNPLSGGEKNEGDTYSETGSFTDPDSTSWTGRVDYGDGAGFHDFASPDESIDPVHHTFTINHLYPDNQANNTPYTVTVEITDNQGATSDPAHAQVTVNNVAPTVNPINAPATPTQVNTPITASATFTDPGVSDHHKAVWDWGDGAHTDPATLTENNGSGSVTDTHTYTTAGVYPITLTVTDTNQSDTTNTQGQQTFQYEVIYEPTSAKVDGSKEFNSPSGAYPQDPNATGKVNFGFRTFYVNNNLTGNARMSFKDISFATTAMDWVTVTGNKIQLQGTGTLVGQTDTYKIFISALDKANPGVNVDTVRVKIWDTTTNNTVIYDSQPNADLTTDPTSVVTKGDILIQQ